MGKENKRMNGLFMNMISSRYADFLGHNLDYVENGEEETRMDFLPMVGLISEIMNIRFDFNWLNEKEKRNCYGEVFDEFNEATQKDLFSTSGYVGYLKLILNAFNKKLSKGLDLSPANVKVKSARLGDNRPFAIVGDYSKNKISIYVDFVNNKVDIPEYNMAFLVTLIKCNLNMLYMEYLKLSNIGNPTIVEYSDLDAFVASSIATKTCLNIAFSRNDVDMQKLNYNEACAPDDLYLEKRSIELCRDMLIENGLAHTEIAIMLKEYAEKVSELSFDAVRNYSINNLCLYEDFNEQNLEYSVKDEKNGALYIINQPLLAYRTIRKNGLPKLLKEIGFCYNSEKLKTAKEICACMKNNNSYFLKNKKGFASFWGEDIILRQVFVDFDCDFGVLSDEDEFAEGEEF